LYLFKRAAQTNYFALADFSKGCSSETSYTATSGEVLFAVVNYGSSDLDDARTDLADVAVINGNYFATFRKTSSRIKDEKRNSLIRRRDALGC
jgi:hypothetical protein